MNDIGIGIIGLGIGTTRGHMARDAVGVRVAGTCSLSESERIAAEAEFGVPSYGDYRELLDRKDIDVVGVFTPAGIRRDIALDIIGAGKHVLLTKPMEVTTARCDDIIRAADEKGVRIFVEFDSRYRWENRAIKRAIDEGFFGRMLMADARLKWHRAQDYYDAGGGWRGTWKLDGGGSLANQTVHFIDRLQWFMGPVQSVFGYAGVFSHNIESEDQTVSVIKYKNGAIGTITSATTMPQDLAFTRTEIHGERGGVITMTVDGTYLASERKRSVPFIQDWVMMDEDGAVIRREPVDVPAGPTNVMEDIVCVLRDGTEPMADGREGRKSIEILNAIYESAQSGCEITLPLDKPFIPKEGA